MIWVIGDEGECKKNNRQKPTLIAGSSGGVAAGVAAAAGVSQNLQAWQYVLIAVVIGVVMAVILSIILRLPTGGLAKEPNKTTGGDS